MALVSRRALCAELVASSRLAHKLQPLLHLVWACWVWPLLANSLELRGGSMPSLGVMLLCGAIAPLASQWGGKVGDTVLLTHMIAAVFAATGAGLLSVARLVGESAILSCLLLVIKVVRALLLHLMLCLVGSEHKLSVKAS